MPGRPLVLNVDEVYGSFTLPSFGWPWGWVRLIGVADPIKDSTSEAIERLHALIEALAAEDDVASVVVGLPSRLDGTPNRQTERVGTMAQHDLELAGLHRPG